MNKEEIIKQLYNFPKYEECKAISEFTSVSIKDIENAIDKMNENKTYYDLVKDNTQLQQENQQLKEEKERLKNCYSSITIVGRQKGRAYEEAKRYISVCDSLGLKDIKITLVDSEDKKRIEKAIEVLKLCNSQCAKETISILKGEENVKEDKTTI